MTEKVLLVNASYRKDGNISQAIIFCTKLLEEKNILYEIVDLKEYKIEFCTNCRSCTQNMGNSPGKCIHNDEMSKIIKKIEDSKYYIFASPTNFFTVTAIFKRFLERLVVYGYWPWSKKSPKFRKEDENEKYGILIASSAMPSLMARVFTSTIKLLNQALKCVGAKKVGTLYMGIVAKKNPRLEKHHKEKLVDLVNELIKK